MDYMSQLLGGEKPEVIAKALGSKIFKDPVTEDYVARDEYLSGNVREKRREPAQNNPRGRHRKLRAHF